MEAMIRKQKERAGMNKASAFRIRKRPVKQAKIDRYIHGHPPDSDTEDRADMEIDSAGNTTVLASVIVSHNAVQIRLPVLASIHRQTKGLKHHLLPRPHREVLIETLSEAHRLHFLESTLLQHFDMTISIDKSQYHLQS